MHTVHVFRDEHAHQFVFALASNSNTECCNFGTLIQVVGIPLLPLLIVLATMLGADLVKRHFAARGQSSRTIRDLDMSQSGKYIMSSMQFHATVTTFPAKQPYSTLTVISCNPLKTHKIKFNFRVIQLQVNVKQVKLSCNHVCKGLRLFELIQEATC